MSRQLTWIISISLLISIGIVSYYCMTETVSSFLYAINGLCILSFILTCIVLAYPRHYAWSTRLLAALLTVTIFAIIAFDLYLDLSLKNVFLYLFPAEFVYLFGIYALGGQSSLGRVIKSHYDRMLKHTHC